ncbi:MAG: hypothetical protein AB4038_03940 [Prochloraceae cyanobacterium]
MNVKPFGILLLFVIFYSLIACSSSQRYEVKVDTYDKRLDALAENLLPMDVVEAAYAKPQIYGTERAKSEVYLDNASYMVNISMLLRKPWRTSEGVMRVREIANSLGITVTTGGHISLSGKVERESFEQIFGVVPTHIAPEPPTERDFGTTGGYASEEELAVPEALSEYVETISVVPPARRF